MLGWGVGGWQSEGLLAGSEAWSLGDLTQEECLQNHDDYLGLFKPGRKKKDFLFDCVEE